METTIEGFTKENAKDAAYKMAPMFERLSRKELEELIVSFMTLSESITDLVPAAIMAIGMKHVKDDTPPVGDELTKLVNEMFASMGYPNLDDKETLE